MTDEIQSLKAQVRAALEKIRPGSIIHSFDLISLKDHADALLDDHDRLEERVQELEELLQDIRMYRDPIKNKFGLHGPDAETRDAIIERFKRIDAALATNTKEKDDGR